MLRSRRPDRGRGVHAARQAVGPAAPAGRRRGAAAGPGDAKFSDRVAGERAAGAAPPAPAAPGGRRPAAVPVAQRAVLYEENQADPQTPKVTPARAVWRLDAVNAGQGQPLETVVRAPSRFRTRI